MNRRVIVAGLVLVTTVAGLPVMEGCSTSPRYEPGASTPPDFALSVTVLTAAKDAKRTDVAPSQRPGRYVVEPDGVFRVAPWSSNLKLVPRPLGRLSPGQRDELYRLCVDAAFFDPGNPALAPDAESSPRTVNEPTAIVAVSGFGSRRTLEISLDGRSEAARRAERVIARLEELSRR